ncbi:trehalose-phosphatase [Janthinobacterium sp. 17J80-10]|uniref:trehalose-phosphatase n=1 Tax=Janthinobacterium sp. 17J80-10 TaxID=2497863 RepID=UPI0010058A44|nr:trehalose-phosphatase [Janthinobacterium sp. 17J80-10]QAU34379.1 trehalose-phosphatase [Janthinobacterium sp. 17J80-10]
MQPLFSDAGRARLEQIVQPGLLCAFDFDGTLAPIVTEPGAAHMDPEVLQRLLQLAELAPVAVLTGRSLEDIRARLGFSPAYLIGNHGLEGMADESELVRHEQICRAWHAQLTQQLGKLRDAGAGIILEDKRYSLSLHYRATPDHVASAAMLAALAARLDPAPRIVGGKCVINLLPPGVADKGNALRELLRRSGAHGAIYVGDDITDESVFRLRHAGLLSVRVECAAGSAAEFCIPGHADIGRLLDQLIGRLRRHGPQLRGPGLEEADKTRSGQAGAAPPHGYGIMKS